MADDWLPSERTYGVMVPPRGFCVWVCGRSSVGKTTLAAALAQRFGTMGLEAEHIDGEQYRQDLNHDLGFSKADREESVRRISFLARVLAQHSVASVVSAASPHMAARSLARARFPTGRFLEVLLEAPDHVVLRRDRELGKRFYARRLIDLRDPFEGRECADMRLDTSLMSVADTVARVEERLQAMGLVPGR